MKELIECIKTVKKLRDPENGCPWDQKQTHLSLLKYLIEESYEFIQAVEENNNHQMEEELGDVLLQVLLHATIAEETNEFSLESCAKVLREKLIRRHPHVFENDSRQQLTPEEIVKNWEDIKKKEKKMPNYAITTRELNAPSLESSFKIGKISHKLNFDWEGTDEVVLKVEEEWSEVLEELKKDSLNIHNIKEEIGDLLFSIAQLSRHLNLNPEECLREANKKFIYRFQAVEDHLHHQGKNVEVCSRQQLEETWQIIKEKSSHDTSKKRI